jgi:soluble lytic murein transglycosylase
MKAAACVTLALLFLVPAAGAASADPYAGAREEYLAAQARVRSEQPGNAVPDSVALRDYPLYPYLEAARLRRDFNIATSGEPGPRAQELEGFIVRHAGEPVARGLRRNWLQVMAESKRWARYLEVYDPDIDDNITARCDALVGRAALGPDDGLADAVTEVWMSPRSLPKACDPAFDWLRTRGRLTPQLIEERARLALADGNSGLARYLARSLPEATAAPLMQWADLLQQPAARIEELIEAPERPVEGQALLAGWTRFARQDPEGAAALYPALLSSRRMAEQQASAYALAVALGASWSRKTFALDFFDLAAQGDYDDVAHEWHVRAALWAGDWQRVAAAIAAMPPALREDPSWRYWAARADEKLGNEAAARGGYATVLPTDNWYAVLSAARLGRPYVPDLQPIGISDEGMARVSLAPGMLRARELNRVEMPGSAKSEWRYAYRKLPPEEQIQAIGLASAWGWHLEAVAAAAQRGLFNDYELLYPRPYDSQVRTAARFAGLPPELIYALIRQESLYQADAGSRAGARGLMQLMPATARRTARRWDLPIPSNAGLLDPATNVRLGAATLSSLIRLADQQIPLALAGYNAGPAAARRWLPDEPMETDVWVENIPYNETRGYVRRVSWHAVVFAWLAEKKPQNVESWLSQIRRPASDAALQSN